jgi:hypothetical protein
VFGHVQGRLPREGPITFKVKDPALRRCMRVVSRAATRLQVRPFLTAYSEKKERRSARRFTALKHPLHLNSQSKPLSLTSSTSHRCLRHTVGGYQRPLRASRLAWEAGWGGHRVRHNSRINSKSNITPHPLAFSLSLSLSLSHTHTHAHAHAHAHAHTH